MQSCTKQRVKTNIFLFVFISKWYIQYFCTKRKIMINKDISLEELNATSRGTMIEHLGIEYLEIGDGFVRAKMPVDDRTWQPYKILHGGASIALAETIASVGSAVIVDLQQNDVRGASVTANHIGAAANGYVYAESRLIHRGRMTHVWDVDIKNERGNKVSVARITIMIIPKNKR